ncbi:hypothetical protein Nepgr_017076 [Nepenthes gracilis]|uniref:Uncharacterized protein n=1 Tax=Nepenthes gracilis TaxID=150966 RepID=A0AAD3SQX9_NEPGR|nr:hypothetical protein Nepgr_017076 [Nepenthes gracilis]
MYSSRIPLFWPRPRSTAMAAPVTVSNHSPSSANATNRFTGATLSTCLCMPAAAVVVAACGFSPTGQKVAESPKFLRTAIGVIAATVILGNIALDD